MPRINQSMKEKIIEMKEAGLGVTDISDELGITLLLQELVKERVHVIENKNTDTNTNTRKLAAWAELHKSFNVMRNGAERTVAQLKNQWGSIKTYEKRKTATERKSRFQTGGGPPPREDPTDSNDIRAWLPQEFETDTNEFDSDSVNQTSQLTAGPLKHAAEIAAVEIRCREQLHKVQMENEERRKRILDLKEQLLLTKIEYFKRTISK